MADRANRRVLLGCGLLCAAALLCAEPTGPSAAEGPPPSPVAAADLPVASDARLAGDAKQTRFILDLDKTITFQAFTLADPYRVVVDIPQISFQLAPGTGNAGRGLVKAFRYGLVMPGGSRLVLDLAGPAKIANSYMLEAANGQPPRLVLELEEVDRANFVQLLSPESRPELKPAVVEAKAAVAMPDAAAAAKPVEPLDARPLIVIDPGHGGIDNGTQSSGEMEKNLVLGFGLALRDRSRAAENPDAPGADGPPDAHCCVARSKGSLVAGDAVVLRGDDRGHRRGRHQDRCQRRDRDQSWVNATPQDLISSRQCLGYPAEMLIDLLLDRRINADFGGQIGNDTDQLLGCRSQILSSGGTAAPRSLVSISRIRSATARKCCAAARCCGSGSGCARVGGGRCLRR